MSIAFIPPPPKGSIRGPGCGFPGVFGFRLCAFATTERASSSQFTTLTHDGRNIIDDERNTHERQNQKESKIKKACGISRTHHGSIIRDGGKWNKLLGNSRSGAKRYRTEECYGSCYGSRSKRGRFSEYHLLAAIDGGRNSCKHHIIICHRPVLENRYDQAWNGA